MAWSPAGGLSTYEASRRHLHYSEITACVLHGLIPKSSVASLCVFPILVRQLFEFLTAYQLIKEKLLCYSKNDGLLLPKLVRHKTPWRVLFPRLSQAAMFLAATKQLYKYYFPSVCLSVCPSVRLSVTPFWLCSHHRIIMKFSGVITSDRSDVHAKGQGQRSKVKVTEVTTQLYRFRTVTPVSIHVWWWNDAYSLIMLRRGALLFFKVICQISRSHGSKNRRIWPRLGDSGL